MSGEIPKGWSAATLDQCVDILDQQRIPMSLEARAQRPGSIPYYGATGQVGWIDDHLFDEELVLLGEDGAPFLDKSKSIAYIVQGKSWVNNHVHVLRARQNLTSNRFIKYSLDAMRFDEVVNGTTRLKLTRGAMVSLPILLPPLAEQARIVEKIEALLDQVSQAKARLDRTSNILKQFRQVVLSAACSGRLTNREVDEDALPETWKWIALDELLPDGGLFDGPFGSRLKTADYCAEGIRVIRLENVQQLRFVPDKATFISQQKYETLQKHTVGAGDIIFGSFVDETIRVCILPQLPTPAIAKADCFCIRPRSDLITREYLALQLACHRTRTALIEEIHGATRPRINTRQLRALTIPLCPIDEQNEIVRQVRDLFSVADEVERRIQMALNCANQLPQTILSKAFSGELSEPGEI